MAYIQLPVSAGIYSSTGEDKTGLAQLHFDDSALSYVLCSDTSARLYFNDGSNVPIEAPFLILEEYLVANGFTMIKAFNANLGDQELKYYFKNMSGFVIMNDGSIAEGSYAFSIEDPASIEVLRHIV